MAASTSTIDPRPSYFGDRMIITGSYTAGDTGVLTIDLSSMLSSIDFAGANSSGGIAPSVITDTGAVPATQEVNFAPDVRIDGTSIKIAQGLTAYPGQAGTFTVIGRR
ncbi:MAG: hypothetical protein CMI60_09295 [Parvibaculum sp.]|nr:hypothetical protein [Parvibaculum sp.]